MEVRGQSQAPASLLQGKSPVPIVQKAGWDPGPIWMDIQKEKNLFLQQSFELRTVQSVQSRSTGYDTPVTEIFLISWY